MDIKQRWAEIHAEAATIAAPEVYVVSKSRRDKFVQAGKVFKVKRILAAKLLVEDTHELATEEQIAAYDAAEAAESTRIKQEAFKEQQKFQVNIDAASLFRLAQQMPPEAAEAPAAPAPEKRSGR